MFDGLLKSKFRTKCKSDIKMTRSRVEMIRKKRNAMQKYLRNDVADLLRNGLDINAYGRAEGLLVELNRSKSYEFIEQYCAEVLSHISVMNKQRECPEECREAVSSLMFAASRFADLPELRELRTIFSEKYGNSLDSYASKQFVENLKSGLPSKDMKLKLLRDIALESGLDWNSKALENKLHSEAPYTKDLSHYEHKETTRSEDVLNRQQESVAPTRDEMGLPVKDIQVDTVVKTDKHSNPASIRSYPEEEEYDDKPLKYRSIPPPYTKPEVNNAKSSLRDDEDSELKEPTRDEDLIAKSKPVPKSVRRKNLKPPPGQENAGNELQKTKDVNKEKAEQGQRILKFFDRGDSDGRDEEENMLDKLLHHYSRKNGPGEKGKQDVPLKPPPKHYPIEPSKAKKNRRREAPTRAASFPDEIKSPPESPKRHTRASSFQPDMLHDNARAHPKLPDYDDFVARLAALRGN